MDITELTERCDHTRGGILQVICHSNAIARLHPDSGHTIHHNVKYTVLQNISIFNQEENEQLLFFVTSNKEMGLVST